MSLTRAQQQQRLIVAIPVTMFMAYMAWSGYVPPEPDIHINLSGVTLNLQWTPDVRPLPMLELDSTQQTCLARNIYHEARGESEMGMLAVGYVTLNRKLSPDFPDTLCGVVRDGPHGRYHDGSQQPYLNQCQFSWYCDGKSDRITDTASWQAAWQAAEHVMQNPGDDPTGGALYYYNPRTVRDSARHWFDTLSQTTQIGNHAFLVPAG